MLWEAVMTTLAAPATISAEVKAELIEIGYAMLEAALPKAFVADAVETAFRYEGVCDLMRLWRDETDAAERAEVVADLQDLIDDCRKPGFTEGSHIRFDDLDAIAANIRAFKDSLRLIVDERGGIGKLVEQTGIPQPSLSRFFATATMPRRATLLKIARALDLGEVEIASPWVKS